MTSVLVMFGTFESLGILIFRGELDIRLVDDFFSGIIIFAGRKFKNYLEEARNASNRQTYYEWFQWLYEQFEKRESKTPPIPASAWPSVSLTWVGRSGAFMDDITKPRLSPPLPDHCSSLFFSRGWALSHCTVNGTRNINSV